MSETWYTIHIHGICQKGAVIMPRPCKTRRICAIPGPVCFGPRGSCSQHAEAGIMQDAETEVIHMTLDEYETIRLMDFLGHTQAEAAVSMGVARTTVQAIYESARRKLAEAICPDDAAGADCAIFNFIYLKSFCMAKVLKHLAVLVSDCNFHSVSSLRQRGHLQP